MKLLQLGALAVLASTTLAQITDMDPYARTWNAAPDTSPLKATTLTLNGNQSWLTGAAAPTISQADNTTNSATAQALKIQAQNATGTTATGGGLTLTSGTGTTAAGNVVIQTGGTTRLTLAPTLNTFVNPIAIGTSPAATGTIALPNAGTINFHNALGTQDLLFGTFDASNNLVIGANSSQANNTLINSHSATNIQLLNGGVAHLTVANALVSTPLPVAIGSTVASAGDLRFANVFAINARNSGNTGDNGILTGAAASLTVGGSLATVNINASGATQLALTNALATLSVPIDFSAGVTGAGQLRFANVSTIAAFRNSGGTADITAVATNSSNELLLGTDSAFTSTKQATTTRVYGTTQVVLGVGGNGILAATSSLITWTQPATITKGAIAVTAADGLSLVNSTAALVGTQVQYSTRQRWSGTAWNTTTPASEVRSVSAELRPVAGATTSLNWVLYRDANDVEGALDLFTISRNGSTTIAGQFQAGAGSSILGTGLISSTRAAIGTTSTDALIAANTTAATVGTTVQYSPRSRWSGAAWNSVGAVSEAHDVIAELRPVTNAGTTTSQFVIARQVAGGGFADLIRFLSTGGYQLPTATATPANPAAGNVVIWFDGTNLKAKNSAGTAVTWA